MMARLLQHVMTKNLPSFWDSKHNLFATLNDNQWLDLTRKLTLINKRLTLAIAQKNWKELYNIIRKYASFIYFTCTYIRK